jgi:hypothetical protein
MRKLEIGDTITFTAPSLNAGRKALVAAVDTVEGKPLIFADFIVVGEINPRIEADHITVLRHTNYTIDGED